MTCVPGGDPVVPSSRGPPGFCPLLHPGRCLEHRHHLCWACYQEATVSWRLGNWPALQNLQVGARTILSIVIIYRLPSSLVRCILFSLYLNLLYIRRVWIRISFVWQSRLTVDGSVIVFSGLWGLQTTTFGPMLRTCLTTKTPSPNGSLSTCRPWWKTWIRTAWTCWR